MIAANYPKKCWYVAATSDEITASPFARRVLGEDVVMWRGASGQINAFENRCAHRAFPLSHSIIDGDRLVCGYHGCTYEADGTCTHIPSQRHVPVGMRVRVFPVLEGGPFVWIWLGNPGAASRTSPPNLPWIDEPGWETFSSAWNVAANYMMVHEHYLDFSYAPILHAADIPDSIRHMPAFSNVEVTETTVSYTRVLPDAPLVGWEADASGLDPALVCRRIETGTFASPAVHLQRWDLNTPAGEMFTTTRIHAVTPEDADSTHVFMKSSRNYALGQQAATDRLKSFLVGVTRRDMAVLEMVSAHSGYPKWRDGVEFQADVASLRLRRIIDDLLAQESGLPKRAVPAQ